MLESRICLNCNTASEVLPLGAQKDPADLVIDSDYLPGALRDKMCCTDEGYRKNETRESSDNTPR
jgi:hypothetical protein